MLEDGHSLRTCILWRLREHDGSIARMSRQPLEALAAHLFLTSALI
jgi:hypothetical protein